LIEIYSENRSITESAPSLVHQSYVSKLNLVDTFEKLLAKKEVIIEIDFIPNIFQVDSFIYT